MEKDVTFDQNLIGMEYKKMQLMKLFEKFCCDMKDKTYDLKVRSFYRNTFNDIETTRAIFLNNYGKNLNDDEAAQMTKWVSARLKKKATRDVIPDSVKTELKEKQNGKCAICGNNLGDDLSQIHVDHIVPWVLVGDELDNNYQDLCRDCNLKKNKQVDYMYKKIVKIV